MNRMMRFVLDVGASVNKTATKPRRQPPGRSALWLKTGLSSNDFWLNKKDPPGRSEDCLVKVVEVKRVLGKGTLAPSPEWHQLRETVVQAIRRVDWPPGSGKFTINPTKHGNGVNPIQKRAASLLDRGGWQAQYRWPIADRSQPGRMDAAYLSSHGLVAFEWETATSLRAIDRLTKFAWASTSVPLRAASWQYLPTGSTLT